MSILIVGLVLFLGIHSIRIFAPAVRDDLAARLGAGPWRGLYSLVSAVGLVGIVWGFSLARADAGYLYSPPVWVRHLAALLMLFSFIAMAVYVFPAGRLKPMLKHPMLVSIKIWALAHLLANGDAAGLVLFGAVLAWAVADRISVKRRGAAVPAPGPVKWDGIAIAAALVVYLLFIWRLHLWLIGVAPLG